MWGLRSARRRRFDRAAGLVYRNELEALRQLVREDFTLTDDDGRGLVIHAVLAENADPRIIQHLVSAGCDLNGADNDGWTALHFAAAQQKRPVAEVLLALGALVNVTDSNGNTPLAHAVFNSSPDFELVRLLLEAGADPDIQNRHGVSARRTSKDLSLSAVTALFDSRRSPADE